MRILVLGGTRFIGPHVVRHLVAQDHEVTIFHRGETEAELPSNVRHVHGDFGAFSTCVDDLRSLAPEVVVDMVPWLAKDGRQGVLNFSGVARRGVVLTSADVYRAFARLWRSEPGPPDPLPLTEGSPLRQELAPDTSGTKIDYDNIVTERDAPGDPELPVTVLRLPATHGPGDTQNRLYAYVRRMDDARPAILLDASLAGWRWVRGYVEDVAAAVALAAGDERASGRVYNVAYPNAYTETEWVRRIARVHGWEGDVVAVPGSELPEPLRWQFDSNQDYVVDSSRIREELGYIERVSEEEGLARTIEWERVNPPTNPQDDFDYEAEDRVLTTLTP